MIKLLRLCLLDPVLPHLAIFRNSYEFEGLIATKKSPLRLANFLKILTFRKFYKRNPLNRSKWAKKTDVFTWETAYVVKNFLRILRLFGGIFANFRSDPVAALPRSPDAMTLGKCLIRFCVVLLSSPRNPSPFISSHFKRRENPFSTFFCRWGSLAYTKFCSSNKSLPLRFFNLLHTANFDGDFLFLQTPHDDPPLFLIYEFPRCSKAFLPFHNLYF